MSDEGFRWVWIVIGAPFLTALVAAIGYVAKATVRGGTYYAGKVWDLLERLAGKHLEFVDKVVELQHAQVEEQQKQSKQLAQLCETTGETAKKFARWDSDPAAICQIDEKMEQIVQRVFAEAEKRGVHLPRAIAENIAARQIQKRTNHGTKDHSDGSGD